MTKIKNSFFVAICFVLAFLLSATFVVEKQATIENFGVTKYYSQSLQSVGGGGAEYYGRSQLLSLSDSTALIYAYDALVQGIDNMQAEISVYNGVNSFSEEQLEVVFDAYRRDHPEDFWLGNSYQYTTVGNLVTKIKPVYIMTKDQLATAQVSFDNAANQILSGITVGMTDFDKELYLHDTLASRIVYQESANAHNSYGALVEGVAVCEGYAEALQYLLQKVGIQSFLAIGSSINPSTNTSENHAWNYVLIDGNYYHVDLTWNDQTLRTYHAYFNVTDDVILQDHVIAPAGFDLPQCNANDQNYFEQKGGIIDSYTVDGIANLLTQNNYQTSVYISTNPGAFVEWFSSNIAQIATALGVTGAYSYGHGVLGNEVYFLIDTCFHTSLTHVQKVDASCTTDGNKEYYTCECGKWFSDSNANYVIGDHNSVKIFAQGHAYTQKLQDAQHKKDSGADCQHFDTYWYDCANCDSNAKDDSDATDKWYQSNVAGNHVFGTTWEHKVEAGHAKKCTVTGCSAHDTIQSHTPGAAATETTPQTCTTCGYIISPALNHTTHTAKTNWSNDDNYHWHECTGCEGQKLDKARHADQDEDEKCDVCGVTFDKNGSLVEDLLGYVALGAIGLGGIFVVVVIFKFLFKKR